MDDEIQVVIDSWPTEWHIVLDLMARSSKTATQRKKDEAKLNMMQLTKKRLKEAEDKARENHAAT